MPSKFTTVCTQCGTTFAARTRTQRFCSPACFDTAKTVPLDVRFWEKVNKTDSCWLWTGSFTISGYGQLSVGTRQGKRTSRPAHRIAWELTNGTIPDDMFVCHKCDVRACVRPDHLFLGTHDDNMQDMVQKGRSPSGEHHPSRFHPERLVRGEKYNGAKLTDEKVREIRQLHAQGLSQSEIARRYGLVKNTVHRIVHRRAWAHVE